MRKKRKKKQRNKEDTREEEKMYDQIVRLFNAGRHQLITLALLRMARFYSLLPRRIKLRRASDYENFEATTKREERGKKGGRDGGPVDKLDRENSGRL